MPMGDLPSWYPDDDEAKPAPMPLLRIQAFLNTSDVGEGADLLADPDAARRWLVDAGLLDSKAPLGASDLELARDVREAIRGVLVTGRADGGDGPDLTSLRRLTAANLARMTVGAGGMLGLESGGRQSGLWSVRSPADRAPGAAERDLDPVEGVREFRVPVGFLRPLAQPAGQLVRHGGVRQSP